MILIFSVGAFAQLTMQDTMMGSTGVLDGNSYIFYTKLFYQGKTQITPNWERTKNELPSSWNSQVCIGDLCYAATANEGTFVESIAGGDTSLISVYFNDDGSTAGIGKVSLLIYDPADSAGNNVSADFTYSAYPTGIEKNKELSVQLYPNPAESVVYLKPNGKLDVNSTVEIMDLTGRKVLLYPVGDAEVLVYDVSILVPGVYLLSILDENGQISVSKKLRVR